jgi:Ca2+-binding RTX toxin-like protein
VTFQRTDTPLDAAPDSIAVANLDETQGADVLLGFYDNSGSTPSKIGVFLNKGNATFNAPIQYDSCLYGADVHTTDVNVDGHQDAVEACFGPLARMFGNGAGVLAAPQTFSFGTRGHVIPAEVNGGGGPELVFATLGPNNHYHLCFAYGSDPDTGTAPNCDNPAMYQPNPSFTAEYPMAVADISGVAGSAARDEIFAPSANSNTAFTVFAREPGTNYNSWTDVDRDAGGAMIRSLMAADVSGDGNPDVVIGHGDSSHGSLSIQPWGPSGIPPGQLATTIPSILDPQALGVADFDRDGHLDIAAVNGYAQLAIHRGNGDGTFADAQVIPLIDTPNPAYATAISMKVADFNGDGGADIAIADNLYRKLQILVNGAAAPSGGGGPSGSPPPDTDGDGVPDASDNCPAVANPGQADGNGNQVGTACDASETPAPAPPPKRTCTNPGTTPFTVGTPGEDVLVGTGGRDVLNGRGGDDCMFGRAGDDRLSGGSGADRLTGAAGGDRLAGDSGADKLTGGNGNDDISPGSGKDQVVAGGGNDDISARDATRDTIDCGGGHDKVTADPSDQVKNCESVKRTRRKRV